MVDLYAQRFVVNVEGVRYARSEDAVVIVVVAQVIVVIVMAQVIRVVVVVVVVVVRPLERGAEQTVSGCPLGLGHILGHALRHHPHGVLQGLPLVAEPDPYDLPVVTQLLCQRRYLVACKNFIFFSLVRGLLIMF